MDKEQTTTKLLLLSEVLQQTLLSKTEIYRRIEKGTFPKPLKMGRRVAWPADVIENYIKNLVKEAYK